MSVITFIDIEVAPESQKILDIGGVKSNGDSFHSSSLPSFISFINGSAFICGHNIYKHDLKYIRQHVIDAGLNIENAIDTLFLSPLLFPTRPYHALVKD